MVTTGKIALLTIVFALSLSACKKDNTTLPPSGETYKVKYDLDCTDCAVIYYYDENGNDTAEYHKNSNWSYSFNGKKGQQLFLFAYNTSDQAQDVTVTITVNDVSLVSNTSYCPVNSSVFCSDTIQ